MQLTGTVKIRPCQKKKQTTNQHHAIWFHHVPEYKLSSTWASEASSLEGTRGREGYCHVSRWADTWYDWHRQRGKKTPKTSNVLTHHLIVAWRDGGSSSCVTHQPYSYAYRDITGAKTDCGFTEILLSPVHMHSCSWNRGRGSKHKTSATQSVCGLTRWKTHVPMCGLIFGWTGYTKYRVGKHYKTIFFFTWILHFKIKF